MSLPTPGKEKVPDISSTQKEETPLPSGSLTPRSKKKGKGRKNRKETQKEVGRGKKFLELRLREINQRKSSFIKSLWGKGRREGRACPVHRKVGGKTQLKMIKGSQEFTNRISFYRGILVKRERKNSKLIQKGKEPHQAEERD